MRHMRGRGAISRTTTWAAALALVGGLAFNPALAGGVITYGNTSLGVNDAGELNFGGLGPGGTLIYGVYRAGVGDAISPGCLCEGWGVSFSLPDTSTTSAFANQSAGSGGYSGGTFGSTSTTATSVVNVTGAPGVTVRHAYGPSLATDTFQAQVTITNNSGAALSNLTYRRAMDWDVPPTTFNEFVTHRGVAANLVSAGGAVKFASDNGFANSNPLVGAGSIIGSTVNVDFNKAGPTDHGSVFDFSFGNLADGESRIFNIYYGSAPNEATALSQLTALGSGVTLYSLGQSSSTPTASPTFIFGFGGVGTTGELGLTPGNPILPFVPAPGQYVFDAPVPRRWFDPPIVDGFEIELTGGTFTSVEADLSFSDLLLYAADGITLLDGDFDGGEVFFFAAGTTKFFIKGINPTVDAGDPTAFPLKLDFTAGASTLTWTGLEVAAIPEPETYAMMLLGLAALGMVARRRKTQA